MTLQLFRRPGSIVFLDDDPDYLEMLAMVMPRHWPMRLFVRPALCIQHLLREPRLWEQDRWNQQLLVDLWRQGKPLIPQVLAYWARSSERWAFTHVCVVDFSMPGMDGLQVLSELVDWPGARVMLTGQADERVAVGAFNRGLIDQFIPKQTPDISVQLAGALERLADLPHARHDAIWRATLRPEQQALLREPGVEPALRALLGRPWVEHVVMGEPFGVLALAANGRVGWLQLETREGLATMAELAQLEGMDGACLGDIRSGRRLAALELRQALGLHGPCEPMPALPLGDQGNLLGALFDVPAGCLPAPVARYQDWLARQAPRRVVE